MGRVWPILAIVVVFGAIGFANALKSSPGDSADAADVQARLDAAARTLADPAGGSWVATDAPIAAKHLAIAEAQAHLSRTYVHSSGQDAVGILLLYGEPGPLGAHTPETCYAGAGYGQLGRADRRTLAGGTFWSARFQNTATPPATLAVNWAWGTGDSWRAPDNARFEFADQTRIFKLYACHRQPDRADGPAPADRLVPLFLADLRARLANPPAEPLPPSGVGATR